MKFYLAPMEGITGHIYRNSYEKYFHNIDKYFTPFIVPNQSVSLKTKELKDLLPQNNKGLNIVPQILTNDADGFILTANKLKQLGYEEINLNLGCPAGTVVSKKRGAGFLAYPEELDKFLDEIYKIDNMKISIKTRLGKERADEFYKLIEIYNKYPLEELIIHPRTREDFYGNTPNLEVFKDALKLSKHSICYNGDIFTLNSYNKIINEFTEVNNIVNITLNNGNETINFSIQKNIIQKTTNQYSFSILKNENIAFDHPKVILTGIERLRNKINYTDIVFNMMPKYFTLGELQDVYEVILGEKLLAPAFRRIIANKVEKTDKMLTGKGHRPSVLFQYKNNNNIQQ